MKEKLLMLLLEASESEFGIAVRTNSPQLLRNKLYALMRENDTLPKMAIVSPPVNSDSILWIVKKGERDGSAQD